MSDLAKLATRIRDDLIERNQGEDYAAHHVITQLLLLAVGPFSFERVEVLRGDVLSRNRDRDKPSFSDEYSTMILRNVVVGATYRLTCTIDGRRESVEETGDVEHPENWQHDGARLKDAESDALKRCAMRFGLGLHLWAQEHYRLDTWLTRRESQEERWSIALRNREGKIIGFAMIDEQDLERVEAHTWWFDGKYPATKIDGKSVRLHRFLMGEPPQPGVEVDHINLNRLDNRRANLRWISHAENSRNAPSQPGTSKYRGVTWDKARQSWRAQAKYDYVLYFLGRFKAEEDAAAAVQQFWRERNGATPPELDGVDQAPAGATHQDPEDRAASLDPAPAGHTPPPQAPAGAPSLAPAGPVEPDPDPEPDPEPELSPDELLASLGTDATTAEREFAKAGFTVEQASALFIERYGSNMVGQYGPRSLRRLRGKVIGEYVADAVKLRAAKLAAFREQAQREVADAEATT